MMGIFDALDSDSDAPQPPQQQPPHQPPPQPPPRPLHGRGTSNKTSWSQLLHEDDIFKIFSFLVLSNLFSRRFEWEWPQ